MNATRRVEPGHGRGARGATLRALLVDPSLFTAPYDAALTEGLLEASVEPTWAVRPTRQGDREELSAEHVDAFFYRHVDALPLPARLRALAKGIAHGFGLMGLTRRALKRKPDVVHFQWTVVPLLDAVAILLIRQRCPVVLTVHDTTPFNGEHLSTLQNMAFDWPMRLADRVIVHTRAGRETLLARGLCPSKLTVIPHGPLKLRTQVPSAEPREDGRFTFVLFGELKHYKGIDLLVESLALLSPELRAQARFIVAGRPRMDLGSIRARVEELALGAVLEIRPERLSEEQMAELFAQTDCFLFPYRQIDASGVYFLIKSLGKWLIASKVGVFAEDLNEGTEGTLVPKEDVAALAAAISWTIQNRPTPERRSLESHWAAIGSRTRDVYRAAGERFRRARASAPTDVGERAGTRDLQP